MNSEELIEGLRNGDVDPSDADRVDSVDGADVELIFLCDDGYVALHYTLYTAYRPRSEESTDLEEFDLFEQEAEA